jgi:hypothetical protein
MLAARQGEAGRGAAEGGDASPVDATAVYRHYQPGQEEDKRPSTAYLAAARAAVDAVAVADSTARTVCGQERRAGSQVSRYGSSGR